MSRALFATLLVSASVWAGTPKYPFPTLLDYPFGKRYLAPTAPETPTQDEYDNWLATYYETCSDGQRARIKWIDLDKNENGGNTVSEGIGYGMIVFVYMDNTVNNTQAKFDKLWKYYQSYLDGNAGVMNWKINGCNGVAEGGAATDAELDVAFALLMAYKQWGNESYLTDAKKLINAIWDKEVDQGLKLLKPGNRWSDPFNPSYFATGVLRIFQQVDPSHNWNSIADGCIALAKKNQVASTGLVSDWCSSGGQSVEKNGSGTNKFGYDAVRTPWRITLDYLWFGTKEAKSFLSPITPWIYKATNGNPSNIKAVSSTSGTLENYINAVYAGALIIPGMSDSTVDWINSKTWSVLKNTTSDNYYNSSWKVLYLLTMSGGFQNFYGKMNPVIPRNHFERLWDARVTNGTVLLTGPGMIDVDLLDPSGSIITHASGSHSVSLQVPRSGLYFAKISGEATQVIPLMAH